ncbi:MAG: methyltransferase [Candidatus Berkelbacteria bacterium]|nr:methyltransferase [Candidatus Berkelbacteria bacterium]
MGSGLDHLQLQAEKIKEYKSLTEPYENNVAGLRIVVYPKVYTGGTDSKILSETMKINSGDHVLDLCTGTGIVALKAKQLGADLVIGTDLNPEAVKNATENARLLKMKNIKFVEGDLFADIQEKFNVITMNPPYTDHKTQDKTEICFWDENNSATRGLFENFRKYLKPEGRVYLAWSDFATQNLLEKLANENQVRLELLVEEVGKSGLTFLVYQLVPL